MKAHTFKNLGALPTPIDVRDLSLGAVQPLGMALDYPPTFMQENAWSAPIYYQKQQPACGAHSGAWFKALLDSYESKPRDYTPRFTWMDIKSFDGIPVSDGTDMRSIFKSLSKTGALDFALLGNDSSLSQAAYADSSLITTAMKDNAQPHIIKTYAFETNITFESLKRAIYLNKAVIVRIEVGDNWYTNKKGVTSWKESDILPLRKPTSIESGHFIVLHSYDENYIYFANSWSTDWGRKGHGYFDKSYMPWVTNAGTAVDMLDSEVTKLVKMKSLLTMVLDALLKLASLRK